MNINKGQTNLRRIPTGGDIMENKKYCDLIYAYLQVMSQKDPSTKERYVYKNMINKAEMARRLKMNLRTFHRRFKALIDEKIINEYEEYYQLPQVSNWNFDTKIETLDFLIHTSNENVITVYAYLAQLKNCMGDKAYFSYSKLLILLGYKSINGKTKEVQPSKHARDWTMINDIINVLVNNGLLSIIGVQNTPGNMYNKVMKYSISTTHKQMEEIIF